MRNWLIAILGMAACGGDESIEPNVQVVTVTVTPSTSSIPVGGEVQLQATTLDANGGMLAGRQITWGTSDAAIATVDTSGTVIGVAEGDATITATSEVKTGLAAVTVQAPDPGPGPNTGVLEVITSTTGSPVNPDGYFVTVDQDSARSMAPNAADTVVALSPGSHTVLLAGVWGNCALDGENPRPVEIAAGDTVSVRFEVTCHPALQVSVSTTGSELDHDGYQVSVDNDGGGWLVPNDTIIIPFVRPGPHTIALSGVAPNCAVSGEHPRTFNVVADQATYVQFDVVCHVAISLGVSVESSGGDSDPDGYVATVNGGSRIGIVGGPSFFSGGWLLPPGDYTVVLSDVAPHCTLSGSNTARATVAREGSVTVSFSVTCGRLRTAPSGHDLLVDAITELYLLSADDTRFVNLTNDPDEEYYAAWSPDGSKIAFNEFYTVLDDPNCVPSPLGPSCGYRVVSHVFVMNPDGSGRTQLTDGEREEGPAWSPDGSRIAYIGTSSDGTSHVFVMNADGSEHTPLTSLGRQSEFFSPVPAWSPDGRRIAYSGLSSVRPGIFVVNADGSGETRLTDAYDAGAAWSPDGTKIAFKRAVLGQGDDIYVMNANGGGLTQLSSHSGNSRASLSWSPDGTKIAFTLDGAVYVAQGDGTGLAQLTYGPFAYLPSWSPDGSRIAYFLQQEHRQQLYLMSLDGSGEVPLTPAWSLGVPSSPAAWKP